MSPWLVGGCVALGLAILVWALTGKRRDDRGDRRRRDR